jgi:hypothetical protein
LRKGEGGRERGIEEDESFLVSLFIRALNSMRIPLP